jgi:hypothetical protein
MITKRLNIRRCIHTIISMLLLQLLVQACWYFNTYIQELIPTTLREARVFRTHLSLRFVIRRRPTPSTSPTRYSRTITHEISFNIEWPLLISPSYSYTHCDVAQDTRHKTHIIVILNRLIRIQYQPYPDDTFNMIFMRDIQLQYLTTCSIINSLLWVCGGEVHTSESGTGHTIRHWSFVLTVNCVRNTGGKTYY